MEQKIKILYEDGDLLVCVKPCGMPSQPDLTGNADLLTLLSGDYPEIMLVHRLDTSTGGVMVYAKNKFAAGKLGALLQDHNAFVKEYLAVTERPPQPAIGEMKDILFHDKRINKSYVVEKERAGCKSARLEYKTVSVAGDGHALVLVRLFTGRTHQIRVQFASRGYSLCGDKKYGSHERFECGLALWSYKLSFPHPRKKKIVECMAYPPEVTPWTFFDCDEITKK